MKKHLNLLALMTGILFASCTKSGDDCGPSDTIPGDLYAAGFFMTPANIRWIVSGTTRSYTYTWTYGDICTKKNPHVNFYTELDHDNTTLSNPFTITAATSTCFGVQPQYAVMTPRSTGDIFEAQPSEIGMTQCFSGQPSATISPFIKVSFTTLGSSTADSLYLIDHVNLIKATLVYNEAK